jgi:hypothetical protein
LTGVELGSLRDANGVAASIIPLSCLANGKNVNKKKKKIDIEGFCPQN